MLTIDFHETFKNHPEFFKQLFKENNGDAIITTHLLDKHQVRRALYEEYHMIEGREYKQVIDTEHPSKDLDLIKIKSG